MVCAVNEYSPRQLSGALFGGDPDAACSDASASARITVTSMMFSLTVATLQLASSQFSPRLMQAFSSVLFVRTTLAMLAIARVLALFLVLPERDGANSDRLGRPRPPVDATQLLAHDFRS